MNRLEKFRAKSKDVVLKGNKEPIVIHGLTFPELADFAELLESKQVKKSLELLLFVTLRKAFPTKEENPADGLSEDDIRDEMKKMDSGIALEIINIVKEVSNIPSGDVDDKKKV